MKRIAFLGAIFGAIGFVLGIAAMQPVLVDPLDLLAIPYRNEPQITTQPLEVAIASTGESFVLPAGTPLIYRHDAEGQPHLAILLAGEPNQELPLRGVDVPESVFIATQE